MLTTEARSARQVAAIRIELATSQDDPALRALLHETPMEGAIDLVFPRDPDYFRAAGVLGETVQTIVARNGERLVGVGTRALRWTRLNGEPASSGYLADLRVHPDYRGSTVVARGYRFLRELHDDGAADVYSTVIVEDNQVALRAITSGRAGLPRYADRGRVLTPLIHLHRRRPLAQGDVTRGSASSIGVIVQKLNEDRRQFAPIYCEADFSPGGRFPGLRIEDFFIHRRAGQVVGVLALWNQRSFRQTIAINYSGWLKILRPALGWLTGAPLPSPGVPLQCVHGSFASTDDAESYGVLLSHAHAEARRLGHTHLIVGLHEDDPRTPALDRYPRTRFAGRLFFVDYGDGPDLDRRVPHVEAGLL